MSFYLRKSVRVGPVRVNMSRSGLGASVGIPGLRVGAGPRGTYVSLGGGRATYHSSVRARQRGAAKPSPARSEGPADLPRPSDVVLSDLSGATALEMASVSPSELVTQLNDAARSTSFWPWCLVLVLMLALLSPWVLLAGVPLTLWVFWKDRVRRTVAVFYDVHGQEEARRFQLLVDSFEQVRAVERGWHVVASGAISTTHQHKTNAGAASVVKRLSVTTGLNGPRHFASNIAVPSLVTAQRSVHFLPDRLLIRDGNHYADVRYPSLACAATTCRFIEEEAVPSDGIVLGHTWQYVNVKGGPDRRYKNNRRLPILRYGQLTLSGSGGFNAVFDFSHPRASSALATALAEMSSALPAQAPRAEAGSAGAPSPSTITGAAQGPQLSRRRLSADGRVSVVGEAQYQATLQRLTRGVAVGMEMDAHIPVVVELVPEPENPHDPCAVRVDLIIGTGTETVGYLSRADARAYQPVLLRLRHDGYLGVCPARISGGGAGRFYGVYLHLAGPQALLLENLMSDIALLEPDHQVTVTREENHQETLARYCSATDACTRVATELVPSTVTRGKHEGSYAIEVRLGGQRVGELTAAMSDRYKHLVPPHADNGSNPMCEALITFGDRGYQIDLRLPKVS